MEDQEAEKRIIQYSTDSSPQPRPQGFSLKKRGGGKSPGDEVVVPSRHHVTFTAGAGGDGKGKRRKSLSLAFLFAITARAPLERDRERRLGTSQSI